MCGRFIELGQQAPAAANSASFQPKLRAFEITARLRNGATFKVTAIANNSSSAIDQIDTSLEHMGAGYTVKSL